MPRFLERLLSDRLVRNLGWMGLAEAGNRVTRLIAAVVLARMLDPVAFGIAALALTTHELIRVLTSTGFGARIVQANDQELERVCQTVFRLNLALGIGLFILQISVAAPIADFYEAADLDWMIVGLALSYLIYPFALVQVYRVQRRQRLDLTAATTAAQVSIDNLLTAALAVAGLGAWAVVVPKILVAPAWVAFYRRLDAWRPRIGAGLSDARQILSFGGGVLGSEVLATLRVTADKLLIGHILGLEALGIYYFAHNAGLGISIALINAFGMALLPHLCDLRRRASDFRARFIKATGLLAGATIPLILLQALLAPYYVPVVFGEQWVSAIPVLVLLCLSALTRPLQMATTQMLRATGRPDVDLRFGALFTLLSFAVLLGTAPFGIEAVAAGVLAVSLPVIPLWMAFATVRFTPPSQRPIGVSAPCPA